MTDEPTLAELAARIDVLERQVGPLTQRLELLEKSGVNEEAGRRFAAVHQRLEFCENTLEERFPETPKAVPLVATPPDVPVTAAPATERDRSGHLPG